MSTFAVFGMSRAVALRDAYKNTPTTRGNGAAVVQMSADEWEDACQRKADKVMAGVKVKQLSQLFDAPQFAEQFIELQRKAGSCRDLHIRYKSILLDAQNRPLLNKKTRAPKVGWTDLKARAA